LEFIGLSIFFLVEYLAGLVAFGGLLKLFGS